jgi:two-component system sensor histidine kinase/response regulator
MAAAALAHTHFEVAPNGKASILYAEDQASARIVTSALLRKLGYEVDAVEDGELAFLKAMQKSYDIILLDIEMPVMDGVTAARRIREEAALCTGVPILAMSAYLADSTENSAWRSLFDFALPKPATGTELESALTHLLKPKTTAQAAKTAAEPLTPVEIPRLLAFRDVLPGSMWTRLAERAADDMSVLALTATACADAEDAGELAKSLRALQRLAGSFEAAEVAKIAATFAEHPRGHRGMDLSRAIAAWMSDLTA